MMMWNLPVRTDAKTPSPKQRKGGKPKNIILLEEFRMKRQQIMTYEEVDVQVLTLNAPSLLFIRFCLRFLFQRSFTFVLTCMDV